jgi:hypothetical protein
MKVVINSCYGGYGLSKAACEKLGLEWTGCGSAFYEDRTNPALVAVVEELGDAASGPGACLTVVEVPDDVDWEISDYDGWEQVEEKHRAWRSGGRGWA